MQLSKRLQGLAISSLLCLCLTACSDEEKSSAGNTELESSTGSDNSEGSQDTQTGSSEEEDLTPIGPGIENVQPGSSSGDSEENSDEGDSGSSTLTPPDTSGGLVKDLEFSNAASKACIERSIQPEKWETITTTEVTILACDDPEITSMDEIKYFTNIETIWLENTKITFISF